ncbi:MAG: hypothetical protein LBS62_06815 [Clostridiales bacterium]|nr:hypothetical protein [Clostridiales bacterium]
MKLRKMLGLGIDAPETLALMRLIETQSKATIGKWSVGFSESRVLPIWEKRRPGDPRARTALNLCRGFLEGEVKLAEVKRYKRECGSVVHEFDSDPVTLAAARVIFEAAIQSVYSPTGSLGLLWYASAAIAYDRLGVNESEEAYDVVSAEVCEDYTAALRAIAVENEPNPAKCKWMC